MKRALATLLIALTAAPTLAAADPDPVEAAAQRAADSKKDNRPQADRPRATPAHTRPVVEAKAAHGSQVVPAQTAATPKKHHRAVDTSKRLHDPTDADRR